MVANLERRLVLPRKQERDAREMSAVGTALQPQQRRSAFPPLLGRSGEEREAGAARGSRTVPHKPAAKERKTQVKTKRPRKATAITGDFVRNERDDEIQRRQKKRAEALVRKWDSLLVREREDRHTRLLQRLELQHRLIAKNDLAFRLSLKQAEEKRTQEIQARRDHHKAVIQDLRAHAMKIKEHKKMVSEKFEKRRLSRHTSTLQHLDRGLSPELSHLHLEEEEDDASCQFPDRDQFAMNVGRTSKLQQLLDFDPIREPTPTISTAWVALKSTHCRKLQPILEYSLHTRELANPTSRVVLQHYDRPPRVNSRSGEIVPLSEVLEREAEKRQTRSGGESILTHALEQRTRRHQVQAEALLQCKQAQVSLPIQEPTMYLPSKEYAFLDHPHHLPTSEDSERGAMKLTPVTSRRKAQRPSGCIMAKPKPLEDAQRYCHGQQEPAKPAFLTEQGQRNGVKLARDSLEEARHRPRWQPLSTTAVQEYEGTQVVPVKAFSSQEHGRYSLWKPQSSLLHHYQQNSQTFNE